MSSASSKLDSALEKIASAVSTDHIKDGCILGLGSGSTVAKFARALGARIRDESLNVQVVISSMQAWLLAKENGLPIFTDSAHCPIAVDVAVDGADQVAVPTRSMIKGGGGALLKEKIILSSAKRAYILGDSSKFVPKLSRSVPVEVAQFALLVAEYKLHHHLNAEPVLRKLDKGYPFYTESGNVIIDCQFKQPIENPLEMERAIKSMPGVVEAGVFNCRVDKFYSANPDGSYESL